MSRPTEPSPPAPFIHKRRITWGDTDTAQIAYTGIFPDIALKAIEAWFEAVLGINWFVNTSEQDRGNPFVHMEMDFVSPLTPRDTVHTVVWVDSIGTSSMTFYVEGHVPPARKAFTGKFTTVFVRSSIRKPLKIPGEERALAQAYQDACAAVPGPGDFSLDQVET